MTFPSQAPGPEATGKRYRLLLELGEGGTAKVFLAVARGPGGFNKLVVLKALKKHLATDRELRSGFLHEARLSARLNHPNVVQVNEVTEVDAVPVIVMEYLEGRPLSDIVQRGDSAFTLAMGLRVLSDALSGLHYSHELTDYDGTPLNLVHRDITPQNVFVTFDGVVKVLDFGIAKVGVSSGDTETGVIKGKLRYMPPEQIVGDPIDRRADIFAMGVMLWELGAGRRMWKDLPEAAIMNNVINGDIPSPREGNPACPVELERICMKALAYERDERYATAAELQADVDALLVTLPDQVSNHDIGRRVAEWFTDFRNETRQVVEKKLAEDTALSITGVGRLSLSPQFSVTPGRTRQRRSRGGWLALTLGALTLAVLIIAAVWVVGRPSPERAAASAPPPAPSAAPARRVARLRVTAFPARAVISIDGKRADSNPYEAELDDRVHEIVATAPGHQTVTRRVKLTRDIDMVLALEELAAPSATPAAPTRAPRIAAPVKPKPDCSTPYYIDERGVKKYKPECL